VPGESPVAPQGTVADDPSAPPAVVQPPGGPILVPFGGVKPAPQ
jgi:hypothetical protein